MPTLRQISRELLTAARQAEGKPFRRYLPGGLLLQVVQMPGGEVVLALERQNIDPGQNEWATTLKHWPERVPPDVVPLPRTEGRRHKLIGRWARPAEISEPAN